MRVGSEVLSSRQNPAIKRLAALDDKGRRDAEKVFVLDGYKLFSEAVKAGVEIETVFLNVARKEQYIQVLTEMLSDRKYRDTTVIFVESTLFARISREKSPQGIITVAKYLDKIENIIKINKDKFLFEKMKPALILDGLRDPGNLGAVIRSAVAFGIETLYMTADCVDVYNPKVLRAAMGGVFHLNIRYVADMAEFISDLRAVGRRVYAAELRENACSIDDLTLSPTDVFLIGNEGHGISEGLSAAATGSVYLPISQDSESLNAAVAASVFLWELRRAGNPKK